MEHTKEIKQDEFCSVFPSYFSLGDGTQPLSFIRKSVKSTLAELSATVPDPEVVRCALYHLFRVESSFRIRSLGSRLAGEDVPFADKDALLSDLKALSEFEVVDPSAIFSSNVFGSKEKDYVAACLFFAEQDQKGVRVLCTAKDGFTVPFYDDQYTITKMVENLMLPVFGDQSVSRSDVFTIALFYAIFELILGNIQVVNPERHAVFELRSNLVATKGYAKVARFQVGDDLAAVSSEKKHHIFQNFLYSSRFMVFKDLMERSDEPILARFGKYLAWTHEYLVSSFGFSFASPNVLKPRKISEEKVDFVKDFAPHAPIGGGFWVFLEEEFRL